MPWIEHARWYPSCDYLKQRKGDLFIEMHRQNRDEEDLWIPPPSPPPQQTSRPSHRPHSSQSNQGTSRNEMENAMQKPTEEEEKDDIAVKSVLQMGYSKSTVHSAVEHLRKQGKSKYSAMDIMEIILDQEERQTTTSSTTITTNTNTTPAVAEASVQSKATIDSQSLLKENQTLKEQMLCKICLDKDASMVYLPCGHMVTCQDCAPTIRKCCICRKIIHGTVKAYL